MQQPFRLGLPLSCFVLRPDGASVPSAIKPKIGAMEHAVRGPVAQVSPFQGELGHTG